MELGSVKGRGDLNDVFIDIPFYITTQLIIFQRCTATDILKFVSLLN
jgi:hypothetical protein